MPSVPSTRTLTASSVEILNAIRNSATQSYRDYVPVATEDAESIRAIGAVMLQYTAVQNEFLNNLVNRIGRVILTSKMYSNPWAMFKKGFLEFGETVEEIFVNIAKPFTYDPETAEEEVFKREIPDVRAAFHKLNYQKFYKATVQEYDIKQAFVDAAGVANLIGKIVDQMYTAANYDEFQTMKYMVALHLLNGHFYPVTLEDISATKSVVSTVKGVSNDMEFLTDKYNMAGVMNSTNKSEQYFIINAAFDAVMDVEVMASAFNLSKVEFMGHRILVDGFGHLDTNRLNKLFEDDPTYQQIGSEQLTALDKIPAIIVDKDFFMIFDNLMKFTEQYNSQGLYWNYFYHTWKVFSVSPFSNAVAFIPGTPTVTSVSLDPSAVTVKKGQNVSFSATVATTNFAPKAVTYEITTTGVKPTTVIDNSGNLHIASDETVSSITVKATSTFNSSVSGTATVTVQ